MLRNIGKCQHETRNTEQVHGYESLGIFKINLLRFLRAEKFTEQHTTVPERYREPSFLIFRAKHSGKIGESICRSVTIKTTEISRGNDTVRARIEESSNFLH